MALAVALALPLAACSSTPPPAAATKTAYTADDVKGAYFKAKDLGPEVEEYWYDKDFHSHNNFVPETAIETCPLVNRSNAPGDVTNVIEPLAAEPVQRFVVAPVSDSDFMAPTILQGALRFGSDTIADKAMGEVMAALAKCPAQYEVPGGPPPILGTYRMSSRPLELPGWKGFIQQLGHTYPGRQDTVYYEDLANVVLHRANLIVYVQVTQRKVIGDPSEAVKQVRKVAEIVTTRLG